MYVDMEGFRRAIAVAPVDGLHLIEKTIWGACAYEGMTEAQVEELVALIKLRQIVQAPQPRLSRSGSKPRSSESMVRRRQLSSTGEIPTGISGRFTQGERAVLTVIGREVGRGGDCRLCHEKLGALAGVSKTTVKRAIREAVRLGLITVEQRRTGHRRNDPSIIRIVSAEWLAGLRLSSKGKALAARGVILAANRGQLAPPTSDSDNRRKGVWPEGRRVSELTHPSQSRPFYF